MGWKMDSHGNWTQTGGGGSKSGGSNSGGKSGGSSSSSSSSSSGTKTTNDKGNTSDTNKAIKITTSNKASELKYAEEATFEIDGDYTVRRGGRLKIRKGVASRWQGKWIILETTHTIDGRGYKTEGVVGRIPYREKKKSTKKKSKKKSGSKSSGNSKSNASSKTNANSKSNSTKPKSSTTGKKWVMDSSGRWYQK